ncbi:MAG: class IV adenylate cyclase [Pyrinomonadaceae bacterium]
MGIEIEKKYRLDQERADELKAKLDRIGAEFRGDVFEENSLYRGGALEEKAAVLRLRQIGNTTLLTYKEPIQQDSDLKRRLEYETEVADAEAMTRIIENLGYSLSVVYEKRRKAWHFQNVEVVLDELPFGLYMEIEGDVEAIEAAERTLEIDDLVPEPLGYPGLAVKFGTLVNNVIEARFEKQTTVDGR